jgi:uncharacterized protein (DUF924 family)
MAFGLTAAAVAEYASRPFIQKALANPSHPRAVLTFFFGLDYNNNDSTLKQELISGDFLDRMCPFWYAGHEDYDDLCRKSFSNVIHQIATTELDSEWSSTVEGNLAQIILCDQLSRNCFRGTEQAFAFDDHALKVTHFMVKECILKNTSTETLLEGTFYPPYSSFLMSPLLHSEQLADHEMGLQIMDWAEQEAPHLQQWWKTCRGIMMDHKRVVERFGRYPHRNAKLNRTSTPQENEWLSGDDVPGWAKSQL